MTRAEIFLWGAGILAGSLILTGLLSWAWDALTSNKVKRGERDDSNLP